MFSHGRRNSHSESTPLLVSYYPERSTSRHASRDEKRSLSVSGPRNSGASKLGTFGGVFVPTALNVLSILMFLRFGFILGQAGLVGFLGMLLACYLINLVTTMSISAIASNGTVRGGGAYYLISRSLGPEFGGSIGIVLYIGFVFNTGMNSVGLIDCLVQDFGKVSGNMANWLPEDYAWRYLWGSIVLILCTLVCLAGSGLFARCSNALLLVLLISTFSIPVSALATKPFSDPKLHLKYTGLSLNTLKENLLPHFTRGAAGSQIKGHENYQDLFGILFPATGGIFAGASMSGDLRNPSRAIPRGTLYGLLLTFFAYVAVIIAMASSITRETLHRNSNVIQDVNISAALILLGEVSTSIFSVLMGVIGSAKLLQALARDKLLPGLMIFGQGTKKTDEPIVAIIFTYIISQLTMLADINRIASLVTMAYLMTFLVTNLACFLLKISSAPNFRPSFHYFSSWTAALGTIISGITMFFVDSLSASACLIVIMVLFVTIHYTTAPKSWGDVSQSLIYHQVRKYLLRLRQEHVKFWRPQILLFVNDPRKSYKLIQFCNSLKKGSLFVLGHVIVAQDFAAAVPEAKKQQGTWLSYIDFSKIKAFVNVVISPGIEWGARNVVLSSGLGGMRPNIIVFGFYNLEEYRASLPTNKFAKLAELTGRSSRPETPSKVRRRGTMDIRMSGELPTDANRPEKAVSASSYLNILEDLVLQLKVNVAIAYGFNNLELPTAGAHWGERLNDWLRFKSQEEQADDNWKSCIDLWPIQMSAAITTQDGESIKALLTTNFDTYTLILQLGCILHTVQSWKHAYRLRVAVFVEYESDVEEERGRVKMLLSNLRIEAEVLVFWLACGDLKTYEIIVNGNYSGSNTEASELVDAVLKDDEWWQSVKEYRERGVSTTASVSGVSNGRQGYAYTTTSQDVSIAPDTISVNSQAISGVENAPKLERLLRSRRKRRSAANLSRLGVSLTMQTHRLDPELLEGNPSEGSRGYTDDEDDEDSSTSSEEDEEEEITTSDDEQSGSDTSSYREPIRSLPKRNEFSKSTGAVRGRVMRDEDTQQSLHDHPEEELEEAEEELDDEENQEVNATSVSRTTFAKSSSIRGLRRFDSQPAITSHHDEGASTLFFQPNVGGRSPQYETSVQFQLPAQHPGHDEQTAVGPAEGDAVARSGEVSPASEKVVSSTAKAKRPPFPRYKSLPRLSSSLVPRTTIASEEGAGPSIMFDAPSPPGKGAHSRLREGGPTHSIYSRPGLGRGAEMGQRRLRRSASSVSRQSIDSDFSAVTSASAFSSAQTPSFNNLPSRAQHLILNELMSKHSSAFEGNGNGNGGDGGDGEAAGNDADGGRRAAHGVAKQRVGSAAGNNIGDIENQLGASGDAESNVAASTSARDGGGQPPVPHSPFSPRRISRAQANYEHSPSPSPSPSSVRRRAQAAASRSPPPSRTATNTTSTITTDTTGTTHDTSDTADTAATVATEREFDNPSTSASVNEDENEGKTGGGGTAVIFTTLQAPPAGTHFSEEDSLRYLEDLETLCMGLPPVLMVHSNSVSVTMSL